MPHLFVTDLPRLKLVIKSGNMNYMYSVTNVWSPFIIENESFLYHSQEWLAKLVISPWNNPYIAKQTGDENKEKSTREYCMFDLTPNSQN